MRCFMNFSHRTCCFVRNHNNRNKIYIYILCHPFLLAENAILKLKLVKKKNKCLASLYIVNKFESDRIKCFILFFFLCCLVYVGISSLFLRAFYSFWLWDGNLFSFIDQYTHFAFGSCNKYLVLVP